MEKDAPWLVYGAGWYLAGMAFSGLAGTFALPIIFVLQDPSVWAGCRGSGRAFSIAFACAFLAVGFVIAAVILIVGSAAAWGAMISRMEPPEWLLVLLVLPSIPFALLSLSIVPGLLIAIDWASGTPVQQFFDVDCRNRWS